MTGPATPELAQSLLDSWFADEHSQGERTFGQRDSKPQSARFVSVFGLAAHTHHLIEALLESLRKGDFTVAMPLLRLAYESAITATWMALNEESAYAMRNDEIRSRRSLLGTASQIGRFAESVASFAELAEPIPNVSSGTQARKFEGLCDDLAPDSKTIYLLYRILSKESHASSFVIDRFFTADPDADGGVGAIALRPRAELPSDEPDLFMLITVMCLVYAGRAVDFIEPNHPRRSELRVAARTVGIPPELTLTPQAEQRIRIAAQKRSRSRRTGKRGHLKKTDN